MARFLSQLRAEVTVMTVDNFDALPSDLNGQRRDMLTRDKRITEFFNVGLVNIANVVPGST